MNLYRLPSVLQTAKCVAVERIASGLPSVLQKLLVLYQLPSVLPTAEFVTVELALNAKCAIDWRVYYRLQSVLQLNVCRPSKVSCIGKCVKGGQVCYELPACYRGCRHKQSFRRQALTPREPVRSCRQTWTVLRRRNWMTLRQVLDACYVQLVIC